MKKNTVVIILLTILINACKTKSNADIIDNNLLEIMVDKSEAVNINIDDFAEEVKYIKLETIEESVFVVPDKIIMNSDGIFILDAVNLRKVFHFSSNGEFLCTIGHVGKGEGEYIMPIDFLVNEIDNTVEIDCNRTNTNYVYNFENQFIKKVKHKEFRIISYTKFPNENYLHFLGYNGGMKFEEYNFLLTGKDFNTYKDKFLQKKFESDKAYKQPFSNIVNGSVYFNYGLSYIIYQYNQTSISSEYFINFGEYALPKEMANESEKTLMGMLLGDDYCGYITNLIQRNDFLYFSFLSKRKDYFCLYNKTNNKNLIISNIVGVENELYDRSPIATYNNELIYVLYPNKSFEKTNLKNESSSPKFGVFKLFQEVQDISLISDNPIIVCMKPKNNF